MKEAKRVERKRGMVLLLGLLGIPVWTTGQSIEMSGGGADLTFFYDSVNARFEVVLRSKTNTVASGLSQPYGQPPGGVGGSANDYVFDNLRVSVSAAPQVEVNGLSYWVTPASGTTYTDAGQPDFGIRTRLREGDLAVDQFSALRLELDWTASQAPAGAELILFKAGDPLLGQPANIILYETVAGDLSWDWDSYAHTHWHWGFSEPGEYALVFNYTGIGGLYGPSAQGSAEFSFQVIPEPAAGIVLAAMGALAMIVWRRRSR